MTATDPLVEPLVLACWGLREEDPDWDLVEPEWFADAEHQALWRWRQERRWEGLSATLVDLIMAHPAWAVQVMEAVAQWGQTVVWPGEVIPGLRAAYERRRTAQILQQGLAYLRDPADEDPASWTLERLRTELARRGGADGLLAEDAARAFMEQQFAVQAGGEPPGLPTGIVALDTFWGGLYPGELVVIGGRPGTGKTTLALNMVRHLCGAGHACGYLSLEMDAHELMTALSAQLSGLDSARIKNGDLGAEEWEAVHHAAAQVYQWRLVLWTRPVGLGDVIALAHRWQARHGIEVLFVDYLQRLQRPERPGATDTQLLAEVSSGLKNLAAELGLPVVVMSSLRRPPADAAASRIPSLADLRGSGDIEHDASKVALLYAPSADDGPTRRIGIHIAKTRLGGKTGLTQALLHGPSGRMTTTGGREEGVTHAG